MHTLQIGSSEEYVEGKGKQVEIAGKRYAIYRHQGKLGCVSDVCPHQGGSLSAGELDGKGCIRCPLHERRYDWRTGQGTEEHVPALRIWEDDGKVWVELPPENTDQIIDDLLEI